MFLATYLTDYYKKNYCHLSSFLNHAYRNYLRDDDHAYYFQVESYGDDLIYTPEIQDEEYHADEIQLYELMLYKGEHIKYLYDFGDCWDMDIKVKNIINEPIKENYFEKTAGENPSQYGDEEDWY